MTFSSRVRAFDGATRGGVPRKRPRTTFSHAADENKSMLRDSNLWRAML
jgi:hypothetical protein